MDQQPLVAGLAIVPLRLVDPVACEGQGLILPARFARFPPVPC